MHGLRGPAVALAAHGLRTLRSLFLRRESSAIRVASQKDALSLNFLETATFLSRRTLPATCSGGIRGILAWRVRGSAGTRNQEGSDSV
jgi:hypothetical protein